MIIQYVPMRICDQVVKFCSHLAAFN